MPQFEARDGLSAVGYPPNLSEIPTALIHRIYSFANFGSSIRPVLARFCVIRVDLANFSVVLREGLGPQTKGQPSLFPGQNSIFHTRVILVIPFCGRFVPVNQCKPLKTQVNQSGRTNAFVPSTIQSLTFSNLVLGLSAALTYTFRRENGKEAVSCPALY